MTLLVSAIFLYLLSGLVPLVLKSRPRLQSAIGAGGSMIASLAGLYWSAGMLIRGAVFTLQSAWSMPSGHLSIRVDPLSALFLIPLFILSFACSLYSVEYMREYRNSVRAGLHWFLCNVLISSMVVVLIASNGLLFLVAWEIMSLSSFLLVLFRHEENDSREAAWIYLIATHIGTAFLLAFFLVTGSLCGSLNFSDIAGHGFSAGISGILFIAALIGFGAKAGFVPFHVWLPKAHPAAPSHVSALMSGIMIKMGIYGILRAVSLLGALQSWWGISLIMLGSLSGILGVLLALGQHDLKRLLAYHSVENIGIIGLGLGIGILGVCYDLPLLAVLGFCGGLLHIVNHALFKGLLFLGAGAVLHHTGSAQIDRLGGLIKRIPSTATSFLIGSIAISGLPPLNGFISEFLIYAGSFSGIKSTHASVFGFAVLTMASLALIGGLATACFTKAFGTVFLGEPREALPTRHDVGILMRIPLYLLSLLCIIIGLLFWLFVPVLAGPIAVITGIPVADISAQLAAFRPNLVGISLGCIIFCLILTAVILTRKTLLKNRTVTSGPTWDCGFIAAGPRIQYTASSFAHPVIAFFRGILFPQETITTTASLYPKGWKFHSHVPDFFLERVYAPSLVLVSRLLLKLRWVQGGMVHRYVLYIALALIVLLIWSFA
jgi:hydrogenase-4 component B